MVPSEVHVSVGSGAGRGRTPRPVGLSPSLSCRRGVRAVGGGEGERGR